MNDELPKCLHDTIEFHPNAPEGWVWCADCERLVPTEQVLVNTVKKLQVLLAMIEAKEEPEKNATTTANQSSPSDRPERPVLRDERPKERSDNDSRGKLGSGGGQAPHTLSWVKRDGPDEDTGESGD